MEPANSKEAPLLPKEEAPLLPGDEQKQGSVTTIVSCKGTGIILIFMGLVGACAVYGPWWASWTLFFAVQALQNLGRDAVRQVYNVIIGSLSQLIWGSFLAGCVIMFMHLPSSPQHDGPAKAIFSGMPWAPMFFPLVLLSVTTRRRLDDTWPGSRWLINVCWDAPQLTAGYICDMFLQPLLGHPFFDDGNEQMITDMSDSFCQGGRPLAKHVPDLLEHGVHSVINCTGEWTGPVDAYKAAGIEQLKLDIPDTFPVTQKALEDGLAFAQRRLKEKKGGRVYIHCKGGRGRASAVMVCCLAVVEGEDAQEAIERMQKLRPIVEEAVVNGKGVQAVVRQAMKPKK